MNGLFLGASSSDKYQHDSWNSPSRLGEFLLKSRRISDETHLAVRDVLMVFVAALLDVAEPDTEFDGAAIEPLISNLRNALLGPPSANSSRALAAP